MGHPVATIALGPILLLQGRAARRRIPRLPEPPGPRDGVAGTGPGLRVLVTGDSAAAGVGAPSQHEALTGRLVENLARDFAVRWRLEARTGATTAELLTRLEALGEARFDVVVTSLGVNDVTSRIRPREWLEQQRRLRALVRTRFGTRLIVAAGLPPVDRFPALPQPLRWYLGSRAKDFSRRLRSELEGEAGAEYLDLRFSMDPDLMASDGFHPGPEIYREWAARAADFIRARTDG